MKRVLVNRIVNVDESDFDFTATNDKVSFFEGFGEEEHLSNFSELYPSSFGIALMSALSYRVEQAYYVYLRKNRGYEKSWEDFVDDGLNNRNFIEPCYAAFMHWVSRLTFPHEVWDGTNLIDFLHEGKLRIEVYGKPDGPK